MKRKILSLLLVMCLALQPVTALAAEGGEFTYLALGDSITNGYGLTDAASEGFPALLAEQVQADAAVNEGEDGLTAAELLTRLQNGQYDAEVKSADLITLTIGGNDLMAALYAFVAEAYNAEYNAALTADDVLAILAAPLENIVTALLLLNLLTDTDLTDDIIYSEDFQTTAAQCIDDINSVAAYIKGQNSEAIILLANQYNPYLWIPETYANITSLFTAGVSYFNTELAKGASEDYVIVDAESLFAASEKTLTNADTAAFNFDFHPNAAGHAALASAMLAAYQTTAEAAGIHRFVNGICLIGGEYEEAEKNSGGVYEISNAGQLLWFAAQVYNYEADASAVLTSDITLPENCVWTPLGTSAAPYTGTFDGAGKTVANLNIEATGDYQGMFGFVGADGTVQNLIVSGSVAGGSYVGGLVGSSAGTVSGCYSLGAVSGSEYVGVLIGESATAAENCYYLSGGASDSYAEARTEAQFTSGEAAWELGSPWGQTLSGEETDSYPVPYGEESKQVVRLDFYLVTSGTAAEAFAVCYANRGDALAAYPSASGLTYTFYSDAECTTTIATSTAVYTEDTAVYVTSAKKSSGGGSSSSATAAAQTESEEQGSAAAQFTDVDASAWYSEYIDYVVENGLMNGTGAETFEPEAATTRGMIVTILYRLAGEPEASGEYSFDDVAADAWYADAVAWAAENGIAGGYGDGSFGSEDVITREQLATILYRYAQLKGYDVSIGEETNILSYDDALEAGEYAIPALQWAVGAGLINGTSASTLSPQGSATRAQSAAILARFVQSLE
ncbi:MAG: S-layer homology domain-containing protein [Oscillospiraceae bacterium]|nr:S-layer homology domain-containing protein [Oscillospiraceae bacterium]